MYVLYLFKTFFCLSIFLFFFLGGFFQYFSPILETVFSPAYRPTYYFFYCYSSYFYVVTITSNSLKPDCIASIRVSQFLVCKIIFDHLNVVCTLSKIDPDFLLFFASTIVFLNIFSRFALSISTTF